MNWSWLGNIAVLLQGLASLATLGTLIFIWRQTGELTRQTRNNSTSTISQLYKDIAEKMLAIDRIFIDHPNLRPYFYSNKSPREVRDVEEREQFQSTAEIILDFFDLLMVLKDISRKYKTDAIFHSHLAEWDDYFLDVYRTSPVLQDFFHEHIAWWSDDMVDLFNSIGRGK
jgi:hypothetical protein